LLQLQRRARCRSLENRHGHCDTHGDGEPQRDAAGDCSRDGRVTVDEIVRGTSIALGNQRIDECEPFDANGDGIVTVDEIVRAVANALNGWG